MGVTVDHALNGLSVDGDARPALEKAVDAGSLLDDKDLSIRARHGRGNLWLVFALRGEDVLALRLGPGAGELTNVTRSNANGNGNGKSTSGDGCIQFDYTTSLGPMRSKISFPQCDTTVVRCTTSIVPNKDVAIAHWPRDLYALGGGPGPRTGSIHTAQRGLRTGIVFAAAADPVPFTVFYLQDFSSLTDYFSATRTTPADTVGGRWPELGYAPPSDDSSVLPKGRETVISDAYVIVSDDAPTSDGEIAAHYLDSLADVYLCLPRPEPAFHDWPRRAQDTLRDLSLSPLCTYQRNALRYLMPYVGDATKPPESMVQLTLAVNVKEYDEWRGSSSALAATLYANAPSFFNEKLETLVRWLPGEEFDKTQADDNMNHEAMDSWYLHHSLFNLSRLARSGDEAAREIFRTSLPYTIRVAQRFDYRWPIFFNLENLDIIRAEGEPGTGGETDVAGLYALLMLQAHEMFGEAVYLNEAKSAAARLEGLGFDLAYQLNTTGFAAEAMLRLWQITKERKYLALSDVCIANLFDNMWLWKCDYGHAAAYRPFFGMFPLRDAPYLAAYEELEAQAKAFEYLHLGGDDVRPSIRLLLAEYQKYELDRTWYFYPDTLPADMLSGKPRNGRIERCLSIPLEDLQDGSSESGQVGQEIYGAGLALVNTTRYFQALRGAGAFVYCNYPMYDFTIVDGGRTCTFRTGGDPRGSCEVRVIPSSPDTPRTMVALTCQAGAVSVPVAGEVTPEGHAIFSVRGGQQIAVTCGAGSNDAGPKAVVLGAFATQPAKSE